jgi:glutathione S-transferase
MALKLYFAPGACSFVPHSLLEIAGASFEPQLVKLHRNEQNEPAFRAINPRGQVPVLVDGEQVITQIVAIVHHIDSLFPQQQFLPRDPLARTRMLETLGWMNSTVHPTFTHIFLPFKFAGTPAAQEELRSFNTKVYAGLLGEIEEKAQKARGGFLAGGDGVGPLDVYALTLLRWGSIAKIDPAGYPALWAHVQKVAQLPGVAKAIERERLQLNLLQA